VELHVHLEGTIRPETAIALARAHGEDPDRVLPLVDGGYPSRYATFDQFVELYLAVSAQLRTPDDLAVVAADFARQQAAQGVRYSEATFTASTHVNNGMEPAAMWRAVTDGLAEVPDTRVGLIVDAVRNFGTPNGHQTVRLVEACGDAPVVALGLAGTETAAPCTDFPMLRPAADRLGLGLVVHAGEIGPASEVTAALDALGADRIGHGVAVVDDREVLSRVVADEVPLEVCPTSNVVLGGVPHHDAHPFPTLWAAGANVTINSDDPPFFGTTLLDELRHAERLAGLERADLALLQRRAVAASFLPTDAARELRADVDAWAAG
jgi:adenosine deaminase